VELLPDLVRATRSPNNARIDLATDLARETVGKRI
jgi:hypothetical protein